MDLRAWERKQNIFNMAKRLPPGIYRWKDILLRNPWEYIKKRVNITGIKP